MQLTLLVTTGNHSHLSLAGEITYDPISSTDHFEILGSSPFANHLIMNLEMATRIDSAGLGWLVTNHKRLAENQRRLVLHSIPPMINQVLRLVKLEKIIDCAADYTEALHHLSPPAPGAS